VSGRDGTQPVAPSSRLPQSSAQCSAGGSYRSGTARNLLSLRQGNQTVADFAIDLCSYGAFHLYLEVGISKFQVGSFRGKSDESHNPNLEIQDGCSAHQQSVKAVVIYCFWHFCLFVSHKISQTHSTLKLPLTTVFVRAKCCIIRCYRLVHLGFLTC